MKSVEFTADVVKRSPSEPPFTQTGVLRLAIRNGLASTIAPFLQAVDGKVSVKLEPADTWTSQMNRLFHALVKEIMLSGCCSYWDMIGRVPVSFEEVRTWVKIDLCGAEVKRVGEMVWVESWTKFSKTRALQAIDNVLKWCDEVGIDTDQHHKELRGIK